MFMSILSWIRVGTNFNRSETGSQQLRSDLCTGKCFFGVFKQMNEYRVQLVCKSLNLIRCVSFLGTACVL